MNIITITNQKGGVGKTTLAVNLSAALALVMGRENPETKKRVLVVDLDAQAHASSTVAGGVFQASNYAGETLGSLMLGDSDASIMSIVQNSRIPVNGVGNLDYVPTAKPKMNVTGKLLEGEPDGQFRLIELIEQIPKGVYEYVIVDTPPSLKVMTVNSLVAASHVIVPLAMKSYSIDSLDDVLVTVDKIKKRLNRKLKVLGIQPSMCVFTQMAQQEWYEQLKKEYPGLVLPPISNRADVEYAQQEGLDIFSYRPPRDQSQIESSHPSTSEFLAVAEEIRRRLG